MTGITTPVGLRAELDWSLWKQGMPDSQIPFPGIQPGLWISAQFHHPTQDEQF
ncbi:hypothetical protein [Arthrobacter methylotrophus]|uniref:hypothetical protein n=1 Tax=Arthrobacter methylotrophus TaxID=121291 RepID=UPI0031E59EA6